MLFSCTLAALPNWRGVTRVGCDEGDADDVDDAGIEESIITCTGELGTTGGVGWLSSDGFL